MNRLKVVAAAAAVLLSLLVGVTAQQIAPESAPMQEQPPLLWPTHPPEPVTPVPSRLYVGDQSTFPRNQLLAVNPTTWTSLGPAPILNGQRPGGGPVSGRLTGIAAHPSDINIIYVAAAGGGVWKTSDGGQNWTSLTDSQLTQTMGAIAIARSNPDIIYAGTGEANNSGDSNFGRGILISSDAGQTWTLSTAAGAFDRRTIAEVAVDPTNADVAYVAVASGVNGLAGNTGIWKTVDRGMTWTNTTAVISTTQPYSSVRIDPSTPSTVYAAIGNLRGSPQNGVYQTVDGGTTWRLLAGAPSGPTAGRIVVAVAPSNSQIVYVSAVSVPPLLSADSCGPTTRARVLPT